MKQSEAFPTVHIFGIPVCRWGMADAVRYLTEAVESGRPHQVITANPIMVMAALEDPAYMQLMQDAELIVPDGAGVVWASSKWGTPVAERVTGFDLLHELMKVGKNHAWRVYLLGSTQEVIEDTAANLKKSYPGIQIVGFRNGYFKAEDDAQVIEEIRNANPQLLFVARGADTQEPWIARYKEQLGIPVMMGVGGSFDIISGRSKRAPKFMQRLHLEWFYRLLREPTRFRRMLVLPKFVVKVMREKENRH